MYDRLVLRPARADEADVIATMWSEAAAWLRSRGTDQWQYPANVGGIARDIARGNVHVLLDGAAYLGTITADGFADPEFWVPADAPDEALYAHRLITRPSSRGASLGSTMLDWASREAERIGKRWLRVDVWKTNADLGRYYEAQGFEKVRTVDLPHRRSGALYQRRAGAESPAGGCPPSTRCRSPATDPTALRTPRRPASVGNGIRGAVLKSVRHQLTGGQDSEVAYLGLEMPGGEQALGEGPGARGRLEAAEEVQRCVVEELGVRAGAGKDAEGPSRRRRRRDRRQRPGPYEPVAGDVGGALSISESTLQYGHAFVNVLAAAFDQAVRTAGGGGAGLPGGLCRCRTRPAAPPTATAGSVASADSVLPHLAMASPVGDLGEPCRVLRARRFGAERGQPADLARAQGDRGPCPHRPVASA